MIGFVTNASWTAHYAVSEITSIGQERKRQKGFGFVRTARLRDGGEVVLDGRVADELINPPIAVIPAAAGYNVIHTFKAGGKDHVIRNPVIAWQVRGGGELRPMTIRGLDDAMSDPVPVEQPDGTIWHPYFDAIYDNIDALRDEQRREDEENRAAHEAQNASRGEGADVG